MRLAALALMALATAACGPRNVCSGHQFDRLSRYSLPYAGHWVVARGDTLTFPDAPAMSDRPTILFRFTAASEACVL